MNEKEPEEAKLFANKEIEHEESKRNDNYGDRLADDNRTIDNNDRVANYNNNPFG